MVQGLGSRVQGLGDEVIGIRIKVRLKVLGLRLRYKVIGSRY